jgi:hypothetical protein
MIGATEKTKTKGAGYLLLHRSGVVSHTKHLQVPDAVDGIMTIIDLDTFKLFDGEQWTAIPKGFDVLIEAEAEEKSYDEYDYEDDEDDTFLEEYQLGAKRVFSPQVVWAYCNADFSKLKH